VSEVFTPNCSWPNPAVERMDQLEDRHSDLETTVSQGRRHRTDPAKTNQKNQSLCFSSRPFVLCGLPLRRLPADQLLYERRNGKFVLQIIQNYGVPFGQDRIVPISWQRWIRMIRTSVVREVRNKFNASLAPAILRIDSPQQRTRLRRNPLRR
jgi:hypothetical protein